MVTQDMNGDLSGTVVCQPAITTAGQWTDRSSPVVTMRFSLLFSLASCLSHIIKWHSGLQIPYNPENSQYFSLLSSFLWRLALGMSFISVCTESLHRSQPWLKLSTMSPSNNMSQFSQCESIIQLYAPEHSKTLLKINNDNSHRFILHNISTCLEQNPHTSFSRYHTS